MTSQSTGGDWGHVDLSGGRCPDCGCTAFRPGPRGGAALNVKCAKCGATFNYCAPLPSHRIVSVDGVYSHHAGLLHTLQSGVTLAVYVSHVTTERDALRRKLERVRSGLRQINRQINSYGLIATLLKELDD
jgi:hypothetical protein